MVSRKIQFRRNRYHNSDRCVLAQVSSDSPPGRSQALSRAGAQWPARRSVARSCVSSGLRRFVHTPALSPDRSCSRCHQGCTQLAAIQSRSERVHVNFGFSPEDRNLRSAYPPIAATSENRHGLARTQDRQPDMSNARVGDNVSPSCPVVSCRGSSNESNVEGLLQNRSFWMGESGPARVLHRSRRRRGRGEGAWPSRLP